MEIELGFLQVAPMRDKNYFMPSLEWLDDFGSFLKNEAPREFIDESFDCDDFTRWGLVQASLALCKNETLVKKTAPAMIEAWVFIERDEALNRIPGPGAHVTIMTYCNNEEWYFLEPQNGLITHYNEELREQIIRNWRFASA